ARLARGELAPQGLPEGAHQPRARRRGAAPREGLRLAELPGSLPGDRRPLPKTPLERGAARTFPHAAPALSRRAVLESQPEVRERDRTVRSRSVVNQRGTNAVEAEWPRRASRPPPQSACVEWKRRFRAPAKSARLLRSIRPRKAGKSRKNRLRRAARGS